MVLLFLISNFRRDLNIVYVLLGISPASNCSWPTFRKKMELTQGSETSANYNLTPGKYPKEHIQWFYYYFNINAPGFRVHATFGPEVPGLFPRK